MTFEDDFCRVYFEVGHKNYSCKGLGVTWPPPEILDFGGFQFKRTNYSSITDSQRKKMTHVARGAEYWPLGDA